MPRAIWSGAISFGLVNVPVKVYTAVSQKEVRFKQLHDEDGGRIQYKRVCAVDGEEVPFEHIVKGYEISSDEFVMITPEELDALDPEATRTIDIEDFVALDDIEPIFFEKPYYLVPAKGGAKAYRVLQQAMAESGKVAIARVVLRTKQYLVALRPIGDAIVMITMNYADEIVPQDSLDDLPGAETKANAREVEMAQRLIEALTGDWEPDKYRDEHRERVLEFIEAKAEGQEVVSTPKKDEPNLVVDLMAALEQSLNAAGRGGSGGGARSSDTVGSTRTRTKTVSGSKGSGGSGSKTTSKPKAASKSKSGSKSKSKSKAGSSA